MRRFLFASVAAALFALPGAASALTVQKAQLSGGQVRIEGSGAISTRSIVEVDNGFGQAAAARIDVDGRFKIQGDGFTAPTCRVIVSDFGASQTALPVLSGCTPAKITPPVATAPSGSCRLTRPAPSSFHLGDPSALLLTTTGCDTSGGSVRFEIVGGRVPQGFGAPVFSTDTSAQLGGNAIAQGTYTFAVKATDAAGQTDTEVFSVTITAPRPVTITTTTLPAALVGQSYDVQLRADGGLAGYAWALRSGTLPPGMGLSRNHVFGHPTTPGTYTFSIAATDSLGAVGARTYTLAIGS